MEINKEAINKTNKETKTMKRAIRNRKLKTEIKGLFL